MPPSARTTAILLLTLGLSCSTFLRGAVAGENYAFLVAVGDYDPKQLHKLPFSRNDIIEFHDVLLASGFKKENVTLMHDDPKNSLPARLFPEASKIRKQLTLLLSGRDEDDTVILAFAGHGIQFKGDDASYFCPLDVDLERKETLLPLKEVYDAMKACPARRKLLLVDACRNDPRTSVSRSRATVDLESITRPQKQPVPESVAAFFSCAAGQQAFEWPDLKHGVFFHHVLDVWKNGVDGQSELTLDDMVYHTRKRTESFARNTLEAVQTPELHGKSAGKWVLRSYEAAAQKFLLSKTTGMKLMRIPAGEYLRGSPDSDKDAGTDEKPQHRVKITNAFYLGQYEVTQGEWKAVMGTEPWKGQTSVKEGADYPATFVSWDDAQEFLTKLSQKDGRTYRLPTEAEWEYAARGGKSTRYSFGEDEANLGDYAWYDKNAWDVGEKYAHPVGLKKPNPFDLYDMHGNVWEWCGDWFDPKEYAKHAAKVVSDPQGPTGQASYRVLRGGSWGITPRYCRSAYRRRSTPDDRSHYQGFRVLTVQSGR